MGDPISPGITIGSCAWMEKDWMSTIDEFTKAQFKAKRFMDDILLVYAKNDTWDSERLVNDLKKSECYWPPLKLEAGNDGTFLETKFQINPDGKNITYRLKNTNEEKKEPQIWRYHHFESYGSYVQKRATLLATLKKVHHMASDETQLWYSGKEKLREFAQLQYPRGIRKYMCGLMARDTQDGTWYKIMHEQNYY